MMPDLLISCATPPELAGFTSPFIQTGQTALSTTVATDFKSPDHRTAFRLLYTGIGVVNTAHSLTLAIERHRPGLVINTGIAGIFKESGLCVGDIGIASEERYLHTGVALDQPIPDPLPFELLKGLPKSKQGIFECHRDLGKRLVRRIKDQGDCSHYTIALGPFITVSTITGSQKTASAIYSRVTRNTTGPVMESMEGAAAAQICAAYGIPFLEIRAGSNFVGERNKASWDIPLASNNLVHALDRLLDQFKTNPP